MIERTNEARAGPSKRRKWLPGGVAAVALMALLGVAWWTFTPSQIEEPEGQLARNSLAIAVLPFENMSNDLDQEFFSDGITEDILASMARDSSVIVRPRSSSFALKDASLDLRQIGERLDVTHVLEGSVRRSADTLRITVQLSDVKENRSIWTRRYERKLTDIFSIQDEITREVVNALNERFARRAPPRQFVSAAANEAFYLGRFHMNHYEYGEAQRWLTAAVELHPSNADALSYLAQTRFIMMIVGSHPNSGELRRERVELMERALQIDPHQYNALGLKALDTFDVDRDYQGAIDQLVEIAKANPNAAEPHMYLSYLLSAIGRHEQSIRAATRAVELEPMSLNARQTLGLSLLKAGDVEQARKNGLVGSLQFQAAWAANDLEFMKDVLGRRQDYPQWEAYAALVPFLEGNELEVRALLEEFDARETYKPHYSQVLVALIDGRKADALRHYREGVLAHEPSAVRSMAVPHPGIRKTFPAFYEDPAFLAMLTEFGLDAVAREQIVVPELPF